MNPIKKSTCPECGMAYRGKNFAGIVYACRSILILEGPRKSDMDISELCKTQKQLNNHRIMEKTEQEKQKLEEQSREKWRPQTATDDTVYQMQLEHAQEFFKFNPQALDQIEQHKIIKSALTDAIHALNQIPNTKINGPETNTYKLLARIGKLIQ